MAKIPTGLWKRGSKLAWSAGKFALSELTDRVKGAAELETKLLAAKDFVQTLGELKGASMKLGQLISIDVSGILPPEVMEVFERLHKDSPAVPFSELQQVLTEDLGDRLKDFSFINEVPLASASMGQVHRGELAGQQVVLKIQYPGVTQTIPQDLRLLKTLVSQFFKLQGKRIDIGPLFHELTQVLMLEGDYRHELAMLKRYRLSFADSEYVIPQTYETHSSERVLCMEFIQATPLKEWGQQASQDRRNRMAALLIELYLTEFFKFGLVQTDPNPGNFLVTDDDRLVLLDFGAVKEYSPEFISGYRAIIRSCVAGSRSELLEESFKLNLLSPNESGEALEVYCRLIESVAVVTQAKMFDFTEPSFITESTQLTLELARKLKYSAPPKELIFLHRKLAGVFAINRMLRAQLDLRPYWARVLA